ncbi:hypothetical protein B0A49_09606, partial [Cryomyces minteri]
MSVENIPTEGPLSDAVDPADVVKAKVVEHERETNMYFSAIGFIYDVKKGPFWEHSPILFDISGIRAGWAKINKSMLKMYNAEVLAKFPVIQHFPFGSFQPKPKEQFIVPQQTKTGLRNPTQEGVKPPWAAVGAQVAPFVGTAAPWAKGANMRDPEKSEPSHPSPPHRRTVGKQGRSGFTASAGISAGCKGGGAIHAGALDSRQRSLTLKATLTG